MSEYSDFNFPNFKQFIASVDSNQLVTNESERGTPSWEHCAVGQFNNSLENPIPIEDGCTFLLDGMILERFPFKANRALGNCEFNTYGEIKQFIIDNEL